MTNEHALRNTVRRMKRINGRPIYEIFMMEKPGNESVKLPNGASSGFPDTGAMESVGFYYELSTAIQAMNENRCDIREYTYSAGFIIARFPGLYSSSGPELRMYFGWNSTANGFVQREEPPLFKHIAY